MNILNRFHINYKDALSTKNCICADCVNFIMDDPSGFILGRCKTTKDTVFGAGCVCSKFVLNENKDEI